MAITKIIHRNGADVVVDPETGKVLRHRATYICQSVDILPVQANSGDKLYETDTKTTRYFDEDVGKWLPERPEGWEEAALDTVLSDLVPDEMVAETDTPESEEAAV